MGRERRDTAPQQFDDTVIDYRIDTNASVHDQEITAPYSFDDVAPHRPQREDLLAIARRPELWVGAVVVFVVLGLFLSLCGVEGEELDSYYQAAPPTPSTSAEQAADTPAVENAEQDKEVNVPTETAAAIHPAQDVPGKPAVAAPTEPADQTAVKNAVKKLAAEASPAAASLNIDIRGPTEKAEVFLDGKKIGEGSIKNFSTDPGPHQLRVNCSVDAGTPSAKEETIIMPQEGDLTLSHSCEVPAQPPPQP